jgi:AraC-like DNA-binding protein
MDGIETELAPSGITGISDTYKVFRNPANTGTVLIYFTETGFTHLASHPAHLIFNLSLSLDDIFDRQSVREVEEKLAGEKTDRQRVRIVEQFLLAQLKDIQADRLIVEAVKLIYQSKGAIRIRELHEKLLISQSPFEKRFRRVVGTTPKKFASIVRLNTVLDQLNETRTLTDICYKNSFFDQPHFIKSFKQFTGDTPENFKRLP